MNELGNIQDKEFHPLSPECVNPNRACSVHCRDRWGSCKLWRSFPFFIYVGMHQREDNQQTLLGSFVRSLCTSLTPLVVPTLVLGRRRHRERSRRSLLCSRQYALSQGFSALDVQNMMSMREGRMLTSASARKDNAERVQKAHTGVLRVPKCQSHCHAPQRIRKRAFFNIPDIFDKQKSPVVRGFVLCVFRLDCVQLPLRSRLCKLGWAGGMDESEYAWKHGWKR